MTATTIKQAQKKLPELVERVSLYGEQIIIVNDDDDTKNVVLISEEYWKSINKSLQERSKELREEKIL